MGNINFSEVLKGMDLWFAGGAMIITGLFVVFLVLVVLIVSIKITSAIIVCFERLKGNGPADQADTAKTPAQDVNRETVSKTDTPQPAVSGGGTPQQAVAVISAAVAHYSEGSAVVRSITRSDPRSVKRTDPRNVWKQTGILENLRA